MIAPELRGPRGVRHTITEFLRVQFPRHAPACEEAWGVTIPLPVSKPDDPRTDAYFARSPNTLDRWPLIAVTSGRATASGSIDFTADGDPQQRVTYPIRVYSWVKTEGYDETQDLRDDFATALKVTLLAHTHLATDGWLQMLTKTMVTDFSDVAPVKGDRFVGGSYVGFSVEATETLTDRLAAPAAQPRDTVGLVTADVVQMPHGFVVPIAPQ